MFYDLTLLPNTSIKRGGRIMSDERQPLISPSLQSFLQTVALVGGMIVFAMSAEHRITVIEQSVETQKTALEKLTNNQQVGLENQHQINEVVSRVLDLHEKQFPSDRPRRRENTTR